ncbi:hypothetical protein P691DRAFT_680260, partial [Macrolepiota fuliginosa MF-IS2]
AGIDTLREAANPDAAYDSFARNPAPRCCPGTREQFVEDIIHWAVPAVGADDPLPLFWMKGPAGVGKSAVAQTCVERLKDMGRLGAAFFFAVRIRDKPSQLFPTIIYQLCTEFPDYGDLVDRHIHRDKTILNKTVATQFRVLVIKPLQELEKSGKCIGKRIAIFIDGLDECESADAQCEIIRTIAAAARDRTTPFCWAFFSRPEAHIEGTFAIADIINITCTSVLPISDDADGDIELYLRSSFENILRRRNILLKSQWPSDDDIHTLVRAANGLFVYVATAVRFIAQPGSLLDKSLHAILAAISNHGYKYMAIGTPTSPFAELDAFYMLIMQRIPTQILPAVLLFLNFLCISSHGLSANQRSVILISNLLGCSELTFKAICNQLSAVVHVQNQDESLPSSHDVDTSQPFQFANNDIIGRLRDFIITKLGGSVLLYHKSFRDFLIDSTRSGPFYIKSAATQNTQFRRCIELRLAYPDTYRFQGSELVPALDIPDSACSLSYPYTNELVNSILKALIFNFVHGRCLTLCDYPGIDPYLMQQFQHADFRKHAYIVSTLYLYRRYPSTGVLRYRGLATFICRTRLFQHLSHDLCSFLPTCDKLQQAGVVRACDPACISSFMSSFPAKSQDQSISGLYYMGHEPKSVFWYWEINVKLGFYREFVAADLAEGGRIYREERFDLWPLDKEKYC